MRELGRNAKDRLKEIVVGLVQIISLKRPYYVAESGAFQNPDIRTAVDLAPPGALSGPAEHKEMFDLLIGYIRHENDLTNHRTTWFLFTQALIGAAMGYIFSKYSSAISAILQGKSERTFVTVLMVAAVWLVLSLAGLLTAKFARNSMDAATKARLSIACLWDRIAHPYYKSIYPNMMGGCIRQSAYVADTGSGLANDIPTMAWAAWAVSAIAAVLLIGHALIQLSFASTPVAPSPPPVVLNLAVSGTLKDGRSFSGTAVIPVKIAAPAPRAAKR